MISYLLFRVESLHYAILLEQINRIVNVDELTPAVGRDKAFAGLMHFEEKIVEVYSFRAMIGKAHYMYKVQMMLEELKEQHKVWIDALDEAVHCGCAFTKTTDPHACHLGQWINHFSTNDDLVNETKRHLNRHHQALHKSAIGVLELRQHDAEAAKAQVEGHVRGFYSQTVAYIDQMAKHAQQVAWDSQRLLMMRDAKGGLFGLLVDVIDDIVGVEEECIMRSTALAREGRYIKIIGAMEHNQRLLSVIETITIPKGKT